ncbi:MAG: hypothetical protein SFH39_13370 [Candidatus Magnetobacterium sp. LHC-1]|nr:hypothetical protein [Nitrospirota bacterium]
MSKLLLPLGEGEMQSTNGRLVFIARSLAARGHSIDVITYSKSVFNFAGDVLKDHKNIRAIHVGSQPLNYYHIPSLVNTFIKLTYDMHLPQTDLKLYKVTAFDDFRGHISSFTYPAIDLSAYDMVLLPIPSIEIPPLNDCDIFYSTVCFYAKDKKIPIIGLQVFPVIQTPPIFFRVVDYLIIKEEYEREFLEGYGFDTTRAFVLNYDSEAYFADTVEDKYLDFLLEPIVEVPKEELAILVINHPRLRFCIREIIEVVGALNIPKTLFLLKRKFVIRELSEDDIIRDLFMDAIKRVKGRSFIMESDAKSNLLMISDVIISPSYLSTLGFASKYNKLSIVYNPLNDKEVFQKGVTFINDKETLKRAVLQGYENKRSVTSVSDIVAMVGKRRL